nr:15267_t:CDS:2 [Entrophospora candida]
MDNMTIVIETAQTGFHNQRIALENAIVLSWFLGRTLVIPPPLLGFRKTMHQLEKLLTELRPEPVEIVCKDAKEKFKCIKFHKSYTFYQWDKLFDLSIIKEYNVKTLPVADYSEKTLFKLLNISDPENQVHKSFKYHTNHSLYESDTPDAKRLKDKPNWDFESLMALKNNKKKLLYFGSLFGTNRLILDSSDAITFRDKVRSTMMPNNKLMLEVVDKIVDNLDGFLNFITIHARLGDNRFRRDKDRHLAQFIGNVGNDFPNLSSFQQISYSNYSCKAQPYINEIPKLFIASDVKKDDELIGPLIEAFPCLYMLSDFYPLLEPYKTLKNPVDNKIMYKFLLPLTDLMVAARASNVYALRFSTFSGYLNRYHLFLLNNKLQYYN